VFGFECTRAQGACTRESDLDRDGRVQVEFVAVADAGSVFAGWSAECVTSDSDPMKAKLWLDTEIDFYCTATFNLDGPPPPPSSLCTVYATAGDSYFQDAKWDAVDVSKDGTASLSPTQVLTGGSPTGTDFSFTPDPAYRRLTTTVGPPAGSSGTSRISTAYIRNDGSENPSTGGAITKLIFWQDDIVESNPSGLAVTWGIAVRQGGTVYTKALGTVTSSTWQARGPIDVSAADFGSPGPNFSVTGGTIEFGFFRSVTSAANPAATNTVVHGIDNWQVRICRN
jgi:hypothetical protein